MYHKFFRILLIILIVRSLSAQFNFIPLNIDYATFHGGNGITLSEIYISVSQNDLTYQSEDSSQVAHFSETVNIIKEDSTVGHITRKYKNSITNNNKRNIHNEFLDVFPFELVPGMYKVYAMILDHVSQRKGEITFNIDITDYSKGLKISSLELASKLCRAEEQSNFSLKNRIEIYPHPSRLFGVIYPVMFFYFEAYNLVLDHSGTNNYTIHYYISDFKGNLVRDFPLKSKATDTTTIAEASGINILAFPSGKYLLHIELADNIRGDSLSVFKDFTVIKPSREISQSQLLVNNSDYLSMGLDELKAEFEKAKYIATSDEIGIFEKLDVQGMRIFLIKFWKIRDPEPATDINEFKQKYFENIAIANTRYSLSFKMGWRTDRGRILLLYGKPDEIERHPSSIDSKPFEMWYYYALDGGVEFIFGDISGMGDYELLHSTHRNEIHDENWGKRVGQSTDLFEY